MTSRKIAPSGAGRKHAARGSLTFLPGGAGTEASPDWSDGEGQGPTIPSPSPHPKGRYRGFRYFLQPTVRRRRALEDLLRVQCELYNAALEERRGAWKWERRSVSYFDQCRTLTGLSDVRPDALVCGTRVCRGTLRRLDLAFAYFYRRCRTGQTPGYPRFKSVHRFDSVQWDDTCGWKFDEVSSRLYLQGIGYVKVRLHRPLRGTPKVITVRREGRRWFVSIRCADVPAQPLPDTGQEVGIDLGIVNEVATSDGRLVIGEQLSRQAARRLAAAQQNVASKRRGSNRRRVAVERVARAHRTVRNQRKDLAHKLSRSLVNDYDLIVHENLKITNMIRKPKPKPNDEGGFDPNGAAAKAGLNRSIQDAGWGQLLWFIAYKAEEAGREVIAVDPRHTSQRCTECGHVEARNRVTQAEFRCQSCGHEAHADVNAAKNILRAGRAQQAHACAGSK